MCGGRFLTPRCTGDLNFFCPSWRRPSIPHPAQVFFARHSQVSSPGSAPLAHAPYPGGGDPWGPPKWAFFGINLDFFYGKKCTYECALHYCTLFAFLCHGGRRLPLWRLQKKKKSIVKKDCCWMLALAGAKGQKARLLILRKISRKNLRGLRSSDELMMV